MTIKGYKLTSNWKVIGGMSEVAFARKDGKDWFVKKFITPKYPLPDSPGSEKMKEKQRKKCEVFEKHHKDINERVSSCCGLGGSLIFAVDFFREGNCYYKINEKITSEEMSVSDISKLDFRNILIIMRSLVYSLRILHHVKIVHGDLKPDNILIKLTSTGMYTTKLIDFDNSYISGKAPEDRSLVVGTPEYYSPEMYDYITDEEGTLPRSILTTKSDIFALGVIFSEYLTGAKPLFPEKYAGTYSAVADNAKIEFVPSEHLTPPMEELLRRLLNKDPEKRPNIDEVFRALPMPNSKRKNKPQIIRFTSKESEVLRGSMVLLNWIVENATIIRINEEDVPLAGSMEFLAAEEFVLSAKDADGNIVNKTIEINITEPKPTPPSTLRGAGLRRRSK